MTLPLVPPISLSQIVTEFQAGSPIDLLSFRRGGTYVDINTPTPPSGIPIPTGAPISLSNFLGARHIAVASLSATAVTGTYTIGSSVAAADMSTIHVVVNNSNVLAHSPVTSNGVLSLTIALAFVGTPGITVALPPGQPAAPAAGFVLTYLTPRYSNTLTPVGGLIPVVNVPPAGQSPFQQDTTEPFTGYLQIGGVIPDGRQPPLEYSVNMPTPTSFRLDFPLSHLMIAGAGGSAKQWSTQAAGLNTQIFYPLRIRVYDAMGLNKDFVCTVQIELNSNIGFTAA